MELVNNVFAAIVKFFTVDIMSATLIIMLIGMFSILYGFVVELRNVYYRFRAVFVKKYRKNYDWKTMLWMPVRIAYLIIVPQVFWVVFLFIKKNIG